PWMPPAANLCGSKNKDELSGRSLKRSYPYMNAGAPTIPRSIYQWALRASIPPRSERPYRRAASPFFFPRLFRRASISSSGASGAFAPTTSTWSPLLNEVSISFRNALGATCTSTVLASAFTTRWRPSNSPGTSRTSTMTPFIFTSLAASYFGPVVLPGRCPKAADEIQAMTAAMNRAFNHDLEFIICTSFRPQKTPASPREVRIRTQDLPPRIPPHLAKTVVAFLRRHTASKIHCSASLNVGPKLHRKQ